MKWFDRRGRVVTDQSLAYSFTRRTIVLTGLQAGVATMLGGRMAWLSITQRDKYDRLAESNRVQSQIIPPRRGWIVFPWAPRSANAAAASWNCGSSVTTPPICLSSHKR